MTTGQWSRHRLGAHEQPEMPARRHASRDALRRRGDGVGQCEDLRRRRDVIGTGGARPRGRDLQPHAVKRLIEPAEVAGVVSFLLGPGGRAFSGAPVTMDLGWTAR